MLNNAFFTTFDMEHLWLVHVKGRRFYDVRHGTLVDDLCQTTPFLRHGTPLDVFVLNNSFFMTFGTEHMWMIYVKQRLFYDVRHGTLVDVLC